ncbi:FAD-dependent oxidoreductase [Actinomadura rifamycini]|uniref:FAD-dependent oxidoreductase n=1 Tax=Actinomadura rifamycini TaxID=31962 RepID=UPI0006840214|nr:FAD/NAD(P)-binding oxidoreductase [Actinomadura rifamycini]
MRFSGSGSHDATGVSFGCVARRAGIAVSVLESAPAPCERALGREVGALAARLFTEAGIDLRCDVRIARFVDGRTIELTDGTVLSADMVLASVGGVPDLKRLDGVGLRAEDGLVCDDGGRVLTASDVWAVGDAAAWWDPVRGGHHRGEHWAAAVNQATAVACGILGTDPPPPVPPYVWSDQFGLKVQTLGWTGAADEIVPLHGNGLARGEVKGTVVGYFTGGVLTSRS